MKLKKSPRFDEIKKAREELVEMGLVQDSGRRRNGQIVWEASPLGRKLAQEGKFFQMVSQKRELEH